MWQRPGASDTGAPGYWHSERSGAQEVADDGWY